MTDCKYFTLAQYAGKYVLLHFWATWCYPCVRLLPRLSAFYRPLDMEKFAFISDTSNDYINRVKEVVLAENLEWLQLLSNEITKNYFVHSIPPFIIINPNRAIDVKSSSFEEIATQITGMQ